MAALQEWGVPEDVEQAYHALRNHGPATARSLQIWLRRDIEAEPTLEKLGELGMAVSVDGRWTAEDWRTAVANVHRRYSDEQDKRAREVMATEQSPDRTDASQIDALVGVDEINEYLNPCMESAKESIRGYDVPPYVNPRGEQDIASEDRLSEVAAEWEPLNRDIPTYCVYDPSVFRDPTKVREIIMFGRRGEFQRWYPINQKLIIVDHREVLIGQIETYHGPPEDVRALRTDHPILVAHFNALFDDTWAKAFPWKPPPAGDDDTRSKKEFAYQCILAGASDSVSLARMMGLSERQAKRYLADVMKELGAETAFELGKIIQSTLDTYPTRHTPM